MTRQEIERAVDKGLKVNWVNHGYRVIKSNNGYHVYFDRNGSMCGLSDANGNMYEKEQAFYINDC